MVTTKPAEIVRDNAIKQQVLCSALLGRVGGTLTLSTTFNIATDCIYSRSIHTRRNTQL